MKRIAAGVLLLALALPAAAQDKPKDKEPTPAEQYRALVREFQAAQSAGMKAYRQAKTNEERQKAIAGLPRPDKYAARFLALAEKHPKDAAGVDALVWVVSNTFATGANSPPAKAFAILEREHLKSDKLAAVCMSVARRPGAAGEAFFAPS